MSTRRTFLLALAGLTLTSCTGEPDPEPTSTAPSDVARPTKVGNVPVKPDPTDVENPGGPVPEDAADEDRAAATAAATATMSIWVQGSTLKEQEWRERLNATLTPSGQAAASTTWGYRVPDTKVTGEPEVIRASAGSAVIHVTTDYTTYELTVVKTTDDAWLTSNITTQLKEGANQ